MSHPKNVLHAIRLVLGGYRLSNGTNTPLLTGHGGPHVARRSLTSNAFRPFFPLGQGSSRSVGSSSSTPPPDTSFLEDDSDDYETVASFLPERETTLQPLPWPSVFPHSPSEGSTSSTQQTLPCDSLARLVEKRDYNNARQILFDLRSAGHEPIHRTLYLQAAQACLESDPPNRRDFFMWLELYPYHPDFQADPRNVTRFWQELYDQWLPVLRLVRSQHMHEMMFIEKVFELCARKGLLASVFEAFIEEVGSALPPEESAQLVFRKINVFSNNIPQSGLPPRFQEDLVNPLISEWMNIYLRRLLIVGWHNEAQALAESLPVILPHVVWEPISITMLYRRRGVGVLRPRPVKEELSTYLPRRLRQIVTYQAQPRELAALLSLLEPHLETHPTLLERLQRHIYLRPHLRKLYPFARNEGPGRPIWDQANVTLLRWKRQHEEAIRYVLQRYSPIHFSHHPLVDQMAPGLPSIPGRSRRPYPSNHIFTSALPSLLWTLPPEAFSLFYLESLRAAKELPPLHRPNDVAHYEFLRMVQHRLNPMAGYRALLAIAELGYNPGLRSCSLILFRLAAEGHDAAWGDIWAKMRKQEVIDGKLHWPKPTYPLTQRLMYMLDLPRRQAKRDARNVQGEGLTAEEASKGSQPEEAMSGLS